MKQIVLEEVDSTNEYLKREYQNLDQQVSLYAHHQTHGKGRNGHVWQSQPNENLTMSFLYKDFKKIEDAWKITQLAACSVVGLLDRHHIKAMIKWPNDIYVGNQKICGILTETILDPDLKGVIVGIGLNVNGQGPYLSMKQVTGKSYRIQQLAIGLQTFMNIYYNLYQTNQFDKVLEYANNISYLKDKEVNYLEYGPVTFTKLNDDGTVTFVDQKGQYYHQIINEISLHQ
ncbi:biotin--[acetyl-CoA-carboxylase] ligase [Coprobacillus sp. AF33-1AC]|uniref:biotin--[acetyl-CoA-carboxylase] ligase n=1 Tax=Coprobacillus sp. AF33-1AC TaxID=2292032 RepID=UPI000E5500F9|nr:biotin--[acetyl-CoA-carboxylase] ligase [Coprobacillus sp. AF33-1AC]RHM63098.1 biotin--[acetyl-CoA-carboxylase] ligase [Coprobacillus sp. AF33-1AC]